MGCSTDVDRNSLIIPTINKKYVSHDEDRNGDGIIDAHENIWHRFLGFMEAIRETKVNFRKSALYVSARMENRLEDENVRWVFTYTNKSVFQASPHYLYSYQDNNEAIFYVDFDDGPYDEPITIYYHFERGDWFWDGMQVSNNIAVPQLWLSYIPNNSVNSTISIDSDEFVFVDTITFYHPSREQFIVNLFSDELTESEINLHRANLFPLHNYIPFDVTQPFSGVSDKLLLSIELPVSTDPETGDLQPLPNQCVFISGKETSFNRQTLCKPELLNFGQLSYDNQQLEFTLSDRIDDLNLDIELTSTVLQIREY
ncbi:MAG: hypothetical protein OEZ58_14785 [Gammaproteobacteria bacterium]|nr:hypothetical protein [Gammaproteobacteria bacterium]